VLPGCGTQAARPRLTGAVPSASCGLPSRYQSGGEFRVTITKAKVSTKPRCVSFHMDLFFPKTRSCRVKFDSPQDKDLKGSR